MPLNFNLATFLNPKKLKLGNIKSELINIRKTLPRWSAKYKAVDKLVVDLTNESPNNTSDNIQDFIKQIEVALSINRWTKKNPTKSLKRFKTWCLRNQLVDFSRREKMRRLYAILDEISGNLSGITATPKKRNIQALLAIIEPLQAIQMDTNVQITMDKFNIIKRQIEELLGELSVSTDVRNNIGLLLSITLDTTAAEKFTAIFDAFIKLATYIVNTPRGETAPVKGKTTASFVTFNEWYELEELIKIPEPAPELNKEIDVSIGGDNEEQQRNLSSSVPSSRSSASGDEVEEEEKEEIFSEKIQPVATELPSLSDIIYGENSSRQLFLTTHHNEPDILPLRRRLNEIIKISFVLGEMNSDNPEDERIYRVGRDRLIKDYKLTLVYNYTPKSPEQILEIFTLKEVQEENFGKKSLLLLCLYLGYLEPIIPDSREKQAMFAQRDIILKKFPGVETQWLEFFSDKHERWDWFDAKEGRIKTLVNNLTALSENVNRGFEVKKTIMELDLMAPVIIREAISLHIPENNLEAFFRNQLFQLNSREYIFLTQFSTPENKSRVDLLIAEFVRVFKHPDKQQNPEKVEETTIQAFRESLRITVGYDKLEGPYQQHGTFSSYRKPVSRTIEKENNVECRIM